MIWLLLVALAVLLIGGVCVLIVREARELEADRAAEEAEWNARREDAGGRGIE